MIDPSDLAPVKACIFAASKEMSDDNIENFTDDISCSVAFAALAMDTLNSLGEPFRTIVIMRMEDVLKLTYEKLQRHNDGEQSFDA